jgi:solute carrier family 25 (mitochondrial carnitine/acylcarnitine transporter), member 20/29
MTEFQIVLSAPYPGSGPEQVNGPFYEWQLDRPSDILSVYFLIRNIDDWTIGKFKERVVGSLNNLVDAVVHEGQKFEPWKRVGELSSSTLRQNKENNNISVTTESSSPRPKVKARKRREK